MWIEVTNLVIPTLDDDMDMIRKMCRWILANLGEDALLHFSRFFPMFKIRNLPPTPVGLLIQARDIALQVGLKYVYVGNILGTGAEHTCCPHDNALLIKRMGHSVFENHLVNGSCPKCGTKIPGSLEHRCTNVLSRSTRSTAI